MNKEIKEKMTIGKAKKILRGFLEKDCYYDTPLYYAIPYLLDYITNLQQENERLNNRIDKAIEYLKENANYYDDEFCGDLRYDYCEKLLDILKGSDSNVV